MKILKEPLRSRPRIEHGVDYGVQRSVVAVCGTRELWWTPGHKTWVDRLSGYEYWCGCLEVYRISQERPQRIATIVESRPGNKDAPRHLNRKLLKEHIEAIQRALQTDMDIASAYSSSHTLILSPVKPEPTLAPEPVATVKYRFHLSIGLRGEQTDEVSFPIGTPQEDVLEALNDWVNNYIDSYYEEIN